MNDSSKKPCDLSDLSPEKRELLQKYARLMGLTEEETAEGLISSLLDMIENPDQTRPEGFAEEVRKRVHGK